MIQNRNQAKELVIGNYYPKYSTKNFITRYFTQNFIKTLLDTIKAVEANTCLDLGTGEGFLLNHIKSQFPHLHIISSDISYKMQVLSKQSTNLEGIVASAEVLPLADNTVDLVVACEVLEHLYQPEAALAEITRVSRKFCILSVPREPLWRAMNMARFSYLREFGNTPGHIQHWSQKKFVQLVNQYFSIIQVRSPLPWTFVIGKKR